MYFTEIESRFTLFRYLTQDSLIPPLIMPSFEAEAAAMYRCKFLFDSAVLRSRGILNEDGDMFADGKFIGNYKW